MAPDYRKLLQLLQKELSYQDQLLEVLIRERAAVARLNQDQLNEITVEKEKILADARALEVKRNEVIANIAGGKVVKMSELLAQCPPSLVKTDLENVRTELRQTAQNVREFHDYNARLLRQAIGLVATTIAIFRSAPSADLPTYGGNGALRDPGAGKSAPTSGIVRRA